MSYIGNSPFQGIVSGGNIQDGTVGTADLTDGSVVESKLGTYAVTTDKLANGTITAAKLSTGVTDLVNDTTPQLGGNLDTNGNDINFGDNDKAVFGAGSDLQIYHDGSNSYIQDAATGSLILKSNNILLTSPSGESMMQIAQNDFVKLFHDNAVKMQTTSTGVDVTGTVTADGLTVGDASTSNVIGSVISANNTSAGLDFLGDLSGTKGVRIKYEGNGNLFSVSSNNADTLTERLRISDGGDISFYEDTGTTAKFFWDASAESLGIGTSSPSRQLHLSGSGANTRVRVQNTTGGSQVDLYCADSGDGQVVYGSGKNLVIDQSGTERMRIDSSGNVGIGTSTPSSYVDRGIAIRGYNRNGLRTYSGQDGSDTTGFINMYADIDQTYMRFLDIGTVGADSGQGSSLRLLTQTAGTASATERMRIDSSGNVGIGTGVYGSVSPSLRLGNAGASGGDVTGTLSLGSYGTTFGSSITSSSNFSANSQSYLAFSTTPSGAVGGTQPIERMRIDSSGNLLVGTTDSIVYNEGATGNSGVVISSDNYYSAARKNAATLFLNRQASDGDIVQFYKDGSTVGSIGTSGGDIFIGTSDTGIKFGDGIDSIQPWNTSTNALRDNAIDLGRSSGRFKDLYLSGGVYLGGTGSANKLEDYEEGTWTPYINFDVGGSGIVYGSRYGYYTKVGRTVTVQFKLEVASGVSTADYWARLGGLPFEANIGDQTGSRVFLHSTLRPEMNISVTGGASPVMYPTRGYSDYARGDDVNNSVVTGTFTYITS